MDNLSEDWQEGNTTPQQRATRWITAVLIVSVLVVGAATIGIYLADMKAQPGTQPRRTAAITPGILRVIGLPNTPTPVEMATATIAPTVALPEPASTDAASAIAAPTDMPTNTIAATNTVEAAAVSMGNVVAFGSGSINIRQGPSLNFAVVGYLRPPQSASVIAQSEDGNWWRVNLNGTLGWLRKDTVRFSGNATAVPVAWAAPPTNIAPTTGAGR